MPALSVLTMKLEIRIGRGWAEGAGTRLMNTSIQESRRGRDTRRGGGGGVVGRG